jgi:hypothetical protein
METDAKGAADRRDECARRSGPSYIVDDDVLHGISPSGYVINPVVVTGRRGQWS